MPGGILIVRIRFALPLALALTLVAAACSSSGDHGGMDDMNMGSDTSMHDMGGGESSTTSLNIPADADFNATDVAFSQGMIVHHGQAVQMADLALEVTDNPTIIALAEKIKAAQSPEIDTMSGWLTSWDQPVPDPNAGMDHDMGDMGGMMMSGMMSEADMARLANATGSEFDRLFLEMMILHHEGAIQMAEQEIATGKYEPTKQLAQNVIDAQRAEIEEMTALVASIPA